MEYEFKITEEMQDLIDMSLTQEDKKKVYPKIVDYLIRLNYSVSRIEAITNNYLDDMTNVSHYNEFKALQEYRKECKIYAKQVLGIAE